MSAKKTATKTSKRTPAKKAAPFVIVRGDRSGVFFGKLVSESVDGRVVRLAGMRQLWNWSGTLNALSMAFDGITGGKLTPAIARGSVTDALGVYEATPEAAAKIEKVAPWRA